MTAHVRTTPEADAQAEAANTWWRENRPAAPDTFRDELTAALQLIAEFPESGRRIRRAGVPGLRRLLLETSRYHVFFVLHGEEVVVLAVWSAIRRRGPPLPTP